MGLAKSLVVVLLLVFVLASVTPADAGGGVRVSVGKTVKYPLPRQPRIIGIEDGSIATMVLTEKGRVLVTGLRVGKTRIVGRDFAEVPIIIPVVVFKKKPEKD